jgi:hypothetical protein
MAVGKTGKKLDKPVDHSPYCAFRSDRERLWALVSRDIRLVLIACFLAVATPPASSRLLQIWTVIMESAN